MNFPESVGNRIRELRKAKGWTQEQLAEAASLDPPCSYGRHDANTDSCELFFKKLAAICDTVHRITNTS